MFVRAFGRYQFEQILHDKMQNATEGQQLWMGQLIFRSPDDEACADGPAWHIDEHFYYAETLLPSVSKQIDRKIPIRQDRCPDGRSVSNTSTAR